MTSWKSDSEEFKKILSSPWVLSFFLMMGSFLYDVLLYTQNGPFANTWGYSVILILYFFSWLFCLWTGRFITVFMLVFNFTIFLIFKEYYKMHIIPLKLYTLLDLYQEGLTAGFKNCISLFDTRFWIGFIVLGIQIITVIRVSFFNLKKVCGAIFVSVIVTIYFFTKLFFGTEAIFQVTYPSLFLSYQQGMLYKPKWIAEIFTDKTAQIIDKSVKVGNQDLRAVMKKDTIKLSRLPKHIYLIQAESLTTKAIFSQRVGKDVMPFLKRLVQDGKSFFKVNQNHYHCLGSANTDFMMMSGIVLECYNTHTLIFYSYPPKIYQKIKTIAHIFKGKGFRTIFLHGYEGQFFNRINHYAKMGFDKLVFESDFKDNVPRTKWGVNDQALLQKAAQLTSRNQKTFHFIITTGMHPPYDVPFGMGLPKFYPVTKLDNYLNSSYVLDNGLENLYTLAPEDSLFIIYGDHNVPDINALHTPVFIFYKGNRPPLFPVVEKDGFEEMIYYVNSLFE